jgi:integrase
MTFSRRWTRLGGTPKDVRDRALLLVGFAGGFRRSELVAIDIDAVEFVRQGAIITVVRSKTDQLGAGREVGVPLGRTRHCPIAALEAWIAHAHLGEGAVFRPIDRHHVIGNARLSGAAVSLILRERVAAVGIDPAPYSGHSLRAGLATSAAQAGVSTFKIRAQTGHASDAMLGRYIRDGQLFADNAAGALL